MGIQDFMTANIKFSVIIVAAGSGQRLGSDIPKQYIELNGKTILRRTLDIFLGMEGVENICIVINPAHEEIFKNTVAIPPSYSLSSTLSNSPSNNSLNSPSPAFSETLGGLDYVSIIHGGNTRKNSVYNGIKQLSNLSDEDIILVHDAARPFVKRSEIYELLEAMQNHKAASLVTPIADTLRYSDKSDKISRDNLYAMQTPQAFRYGLLKRAHEEYSDNSYTDDTALMQEMGVDVKFIVGSKENFKITLKEDLELAQKILSIELSTRTGQGFDVHRFSDVKTENIRLCGVDIPHNRSLQGHSDADVALHALTDAILGAIGEGDIGLHFPPSNQDFKDMDSAVFVRHAMKLLRDKGGELVNADITIICEAPKISNHRDKIIDRLANIMEICKTRINIKATTTEKLGFTGRGEGIAAQAIVSVSI